MGLGFHPRTDSAYLAFEVSPGCFNLGGAQAPAAIRDQMVRACMLVDQLLLSGRIGPGRQLAVVGGGVGGMTAALRAISGSAATVIERAGDAFSLLRQSATRRVDPTLFDWPMEHWRAGKIPWDVVPPMPDIPLRWHGDQTDSVVAQIWDPLIASLPQNALLQQELNARVLGYRVGPDNTFHIRVRRPWGREELGPFGAVIFAAGYGPERTGIETTVQPGAVTHRYHGFPFWSLDPFERQSYGLDKPLDAPPVLDPEPMPIDAPVIVISGSGDGALQDLQRLVLTNPPGTRGTFSTGAWFKGLEEALQHASHASGLVWPTEGWAATLAAIQAVEQQAERALFWSQQHVPGTVVARVDAVHKRQVEILLADTVLGPALHQYIHDRLRPNHGEVYLLYRGAGFSPCYALNRFVAHLLHACSQQAGWSGPPLHVVSMGPNTRVEVSGRHHVCTGDYLACHGRRHLVRVVAPPMAPELDLEAHLVIVRHGIETGSTIPGVPNLPLPRQLLPYHLPG